MTVAKRERLDFIPLSPAEKRSMGKEGKKSKEKDREKISKKKAADGDKEHGKKGNKDKDVHKRVTGSLDGENRPNNAVRPPKKQKNGKEVVTVHEGANGIVAAERKAKNEAWNPKIEGQKFGEWSKDEKEELDARIKEWAMAHGKIDDYNNKKFDFLMQRRQKQGGRGAKLPDSERKAFLEIATGFPTRNPKQIYGYVSRHYDSDNYKGKWSDEEKKKLTDLVAEYGEKWKEVGKNLGRPGHACRDKWRMMRNNPKSGDWSPAEVAHLRELVNEYFAQNNAAPGRGAGEGTSTCRCATTSTGRPYRARLEPEAKTCACKSGTASPRARRRLGSGRKVTTRPCSRASSSLMRTTSTRLRGKGWSPVEPSARSKTGSGLRKRIFPTTAT